MSESTRALCQIIERRPFLTLTDDELELIVAGLTGEAMRQRADGNLRYALLAEVVWQELKQRRADKATTDTVRCDNFHVPPPGLDGPFRPIHCEGLDGHDGPHFIGSHLTRREWR